MSKCKKIYQTIFSVKNENKRKVITLLGLKLKIKTKRFFQKVNEDIATQDSYDLSALQNTEKLNLFFIPNDNKISGGIISIFYFCQFSRALGPDYLCLISTVPGYLTYAKNKAFKNDEQIYRWEQIVRNADNVSELIINIPEYFADKFYKSLSRKEIKFLKSIKNLRINILNLNIKMMPKPKKLKSLYKLTPNISQMTGFERYTTQETCDKFELPTYRVPAFSNLNECVKKDFEDKKKLILYSPDPHPMKSKILENLQNELPDFKFKEINNLTYSEFLELIAEAAFCISFGEGFDGYYIQPYYAKGIGVTVYNETFFISQKIKAFPFVYDSYEQLNTRLADDIKRVFNNKEKYEKITTNIHQYLDNNINKGNNTKIGIVSFYKNEPTYIPHYKLNSIKNHIQFFKDIKDEANFSKEFPSIFCQKVYSLINCCSHYYYPESIHDYEPDFSKDVKVEKCAFTRLQRRRRLWKTLCEKHNIEELEKSYNLFEDEYSKEMFIMVLIYNLSKEPLLRFPLFYSKVYNEIPYFKDFLIGDGQISLWFDNIRAKQYDLKKLGYDLKLWGNPGGLIIEFILDQYKYKHIVEIGENDNIIDGGGCYGDTALNFATKTTGTIHSFEFMEENLNIFNRNLKLNPKYSKNIKIIEKPLSTNSNEKLYSVFNGPGTHISNEKSPNAIEFETISIDDYVEQNNIDKIDFIKLDVEGSEESILKGAVKTIKKFRPKLAICAYHKPDDLTVLPNLIKEILPDYKLYLNHNTIVNTETVIYAKT